MNVNSTSTTSAAASKGLSGLASGLDTDSMVESMLSGVQSKINKQKQEQQTLTWKQEQYREIITKINDFQDKYFSVTSNTSLRSSSLFNSSVAESTNSSAVKIISSSNSSNSEFSVEVDNIATASSVTSKKASSDSISISNTAKDYSRKVTFTYKTGEDDNGEATYDKIEIDLSQLKDASGQTDKETFVNDLNSKLAGSGITAVFTPADGDKEASISFKSDVQFGITGSTAGLKMIGCASETLAVKETDDDGKEIENGAYVSSSNSFDPDASMSGEITISLDGVSKSFTLNEGQTLKDISSDIQKAFGSGLNIKEENGKTVISANGAGRTVSISASDETKETLSMSSVDTSSRISVTSTVSEILAKNGISAASGKLTINDVEIEYSADDTISQVISKVNNSNAGVKMTYDGLSDTFSVKSNSTGSDFTLSISDSGNLFSTLGFDMNSDGSINESSSNYQAGQNAKIKINGVEVERAGNKIQYDGVTFEVKSATNGTAATVTAEKNVDKIMTVLTDFVNDYNTLIADLNKYTHEEATYKDYPPLTDAQKKEMTENEIKLWEEKSKTGLLRNDSDISSFLQDMRAVLYTKGSDSSLVLSNIGIDSSSDWKEYGKLSIDEDTLKNALENNSEKIADMFANVETGIGKRLNDVCKAAANTSSGSPGSLVSMAGVVGKATEKDNVIYDKLERIKEKLESLNTLYEKRKEKYWNMFNTMETTISNYGSQSDYLSQLTF